MEATPEIKKPGWEQFHRPNQIPPIQQKICVSNCKLNMDIQDGATGNFINNEFNEQTFQDGYYSLQSRLENNYENSKSWLKPFEWLEDIVIKVDKFYVDLDFTPLDDNGCEKKTKSVQKLDYLYSDGLEAKRTLIIGEGGFGKTTLCSKMAHDWATNKDRILSSYGILMVYHLRDLVEEKSLEKQLLEFGQQDERVIREILKRVTSRFILVLDGLDEVAAKVQEEVSDLLNGSNAFHQATILVTSRRLQRPDYVKGFRQKIKIKALSGKNQDKLVQNYLGEPFKQTNWHQYGRGTLHYRIGRFLDDVNSKQDASKEENGLSPLLLMLVCYCYENSTSSIGSHFELFQNIFDILGQRCCQKKVLRLSEEDRREVVFKIGEMFCRQSEYQCTYREEELRSLYPDDPERQEFVLNFCLFNRVASQAGLKMESSYQLSHKLLYDHAKLTFLHSAAKKGHEIVPLLQNGFRGMCLCVEKETSSRLKGKRVEGMIIFLDVGELDVRASSTDPSPNIILQSGASERRQSGFTNDTFFRFPKAPGKVEVVSELLDLQMDDHLGEFYKKLFEKNGDALLDVTWDEQPQRLTIRHSHNGKELVCYDYFSGFPFPDLLEKLSKVNHRSLGEIPTDQSNSDPKLVPWKDSFDFERELPPRNSDTSRLDAVHEVVRVWVRRPLDREGTRLHLVICYKIKGKGCELQFFRWKESENYVLIYDKDDKRHVTTVEDIERDKSYLDSFPEITNTDRIRIQKDSEEPMEYFDGIRIEYEDLTLKGRVKYAYIPIY